MRPSEPVPATPPPPPQRHPPAAVAYIIGGTIVFSPLSRSALERLRRRGLPVRKRWLSQPELRFDDAAESLDARFERLAPIFRALTGAGVAFLDDPKQGWSPADHLEELVARGLMPGGHASSFDGRHWLLRPVGSPPIVGGPTYATGEEVRVGDRVRVARSLSGRCRRRTSPPAAPRRNFPRPRA